MPTIYSIVYQPERPASPAQPPHFVRVPLERANLIHDYGIEGDQKGRKGSSRQLNLMSYEELERLRAEGYDTAPGRMGEQIIIRGMEVIDLAPGTRLRIGATAEIEITKPRTGCSWLERVQGKPKANTVNRLGVLARVVVAGQIAVGDEVQVIAQPERG